MTKSLLICLGKHSKDWTPDEVKEMAGEFRTFVRREDLNLSEINAGRKVLFERIKDTEQEIAQIERVVEAHFEKKPRKGGTPKVAKPAKSPPGAAKELETAKKGTPELTDANILENAGLIVAETMTKPKKAGKKSRPVWEVSGMIEPYVEIIRDMGGRKWGGKYSFWEDPTSELAEAIRDQGGMSFAEQMDAKQERAGGKADRLGERAEKARGRAKSAREAEERISEFIPMGQPILVGHHSEKRARRDQERIQKLTRDQITEAGKAKWLDDRARLQRDVAKGEFSLSFMQNRIDETEADIRRLNRILSGEHYGADPLKNEQYRKRIAKTLAEAQEKIEYWKEGVEAAGGINYSKENVSKGDRVYIRGAWCTVIRANPKTVTVEVAEGGAKGMVLKYKYAEIKKADIDEVAPEIKPAEKAVTPEPAPEKPATLDKKTEGRVASLRKAADSLQKQIDIKRSPAIATQNLTARRANIAASMAADADKLEQVQMVMRGLADDAENGTLPETLAGINSKAQIEQILNSERFFPPSFHKAYVKDVVAALKGVKGLASERMDADDISRRVIHADYQIDLRTKGEVKAVEAAIKRDPSGLSQVKDGVMEGKRLIALNIHDQEEYDAVRERLLGYLAPPDPVKGLQAQIREKEAELIGAKIPGFFPTPGPVAAKMVEAAEIQPDDYILEPSAGKGDLAVIIKEAHPENDIQVAEIGQTFREILDLKGFEIIGDDFLDMELSKPGVQGLDVPYDKIIMNPPFEHFQDIDHVKHAYDLLSKGGRIVALMSEGAFFRTEKKAAEFRAWLDELGADIHKLADKSFTGKDAFRQTGVAVRMVVIDKAGERAKPEAGIQEPAPKPWGVFPNVIAHTSVSKIEAHPDHDAAKQGGVDAANRLVGDLVKKERARALGQRHPGAILVGIQSVEAAGENKIPMAFAQAINSVTGQEVDTDIFQSNVTAHSDKTGLQRLLARAKFAGEVKKGRDYIILDDVITQGGTVSELKQYIERNGGNVVEATALACAQFSNTIAVQKTTIGKLITKYGREDLESILKENGIPQSIESLTQSEARQIALYKGPDSFRAAIAKERNAASSEAVKETLPGKSPEVKLSAIDSVQEMTWMDAKHIKEAMLTAERALNKVLGPDVMQYITTELKPFIDLSTMNAEMYQKSLQEHGGKINSIAGLTIVNEFYALVRLVYTFDVKIVESTAFHEAFHVACRWLLPTDEYVAMMKSFEGNEEAAANAFSWFATAATGKDLNQHPGFIRGIFLQLKRYFQMLRNALQGRGFFRPEDVFGKLYVGGYDRRLPLPVRRSRMGASFSSYDKGKYSYEINCVGCTDVEALDQMIDDSREVTYDTFIKNVDAAELARMFDLYDWGPGRKSGLRLRDDYAVSYYKSKYQGRPVYYIEHSAIEYIFTRPEASYSVVVEPMYSQLVKAVEDARDMPLKAQSLMNWLKKRSKPAELKWLGVEDWLAANTDEKGRINKEEFLEYLQSNQVTVNETMRYEGGGVTPDALAWSTPAFVESPEVGEFDELEELSTDPFDPYRDTESYAVDGDSQDVYAIIGNEGTGYNLYLERDGLNEKELLTCKETRIDAEWFAGDDLRRRHSLPEARYEGHNLEGGEDYKELLLTYAPPKGQVRKEFSVIVFGTKGFKVVDNVFGVSFPLDKEEAYYFHDAQEAQDKALELNAIEATKPDVVEAPKYISPHWNETNVLAHIRFDDRVDSRGKKVLFIEEIQSDWHQAGKAYGYEGEQRADYNFVVVENTGQVGPMFSEKYWATLNGVVVGGGRTEATALRAAKRSMGESLEPASKRPPPAPFAKTWHEYTMKRMLRFAAENGYDSIAWTTGKQQIKRYDLRHHLDLISWLVVSHGASARINPTVKIMGYKNGEVLISRQVNVATELDALVGKVMGDKIRKEVVAGNSHGNLDANDMVVGGTGMESFYDQLIPGFMKKYTKQWKGSVSTAKVSVGTKPDMADYKGPDYTLAELEAIKKGVVEYAQRGQPIMSPEVYYDLHSTLAYMKSSGVSFKEAIYYYGTKELGAFLGGSVERFADIDLREVHSVEITPEMSRDVLFTGQVMFSKAKQPDEDRAWAQQFIADAIADAADNPGDKKAQDKAERIKEEQAWFDEEWPKALYQSAKDVIKAFKMGKKEGWVGMKPDTTFLERWLQTPEYYYKKVPAAWRVFMASLERQDDRNQYYNDITEGDVLLGEIINLKKDRPKEYERLQKLIVKADQFKITHGPSSLRKMGFSDQAINAFVAFRKMMDNGFDLLYEDMSRIIAEYEEAGLDLPEVAVWVGDKQLLVNLKVALAEMGKMRGWYFPRQRKSGNWILTATKKGTNPIMEIFELVGFANKRGIDLKKQGYTVHKMNTSQMPEDVFKMAGKTIGLNAMINMALSKTIPEKLPTFEEYGLTPIMRTGPTGRKDFIVRGPTNKATNAVMKSLGGMFWSSAAGEPKAWHFNDAPSDMNFRVLRALTTAKGIPGAAETDLLFAHALAVEVANVIKGRGFRSAMIGRKEAKTGGDVWIGYDTDLATVASQYVTGLASGLAKKNVAAKMVQAVTGTDVKPHQFESFEDYLDAVSARKIDPDKQKNIFHDVTTYIEEMLRNQEFSDRLIGTIKGVTVLKYLGLRLASPVVNLTALLTSVPANMHGLAGVPIMETIKYLVDAAGDYNVYVRGDKSKLDPDIVEMFDHIIAKGWDNAQYNMEALAVLRSKLGNKWKWVMEKSMFMFGATEKLNRVATIMGTYKALKAQGRTDTKVMIDLSKHVSDRAHATYGKITHPYMALGKNPAAQAVQCLYVFSKFSHNYLQSMYELGYKKHQWQSVLWMAVSPMILAGAGSLPLLWPVLMGTLRELFDVDEPEERFYSWFDDHLGEFGGNFIRYGLAGAGGYGVSLKGSLAIDPVESFPTRLPEIFGAPGNVLTDVYDGGVSLVKGDFIGAVKSAGPRFSGSMIQAVQEEIYGVTTRRQTPKFLKGKKMEPENLDTVLRFMNFNPAHMAKIKEQKWSEQRLVGKYRDLRSDIYKRIKAYFQKPSYLRSEREHISLLADIDEYNKRVTSRDLQNIDGISIITDKTIDASLKLTK